jgi:hypothetical protein
VLDLYKSKRVGVVLRVYASSSEAMQKRVVMALETVEILHGLEVDGQKLIQEVDILVPRDERYTQFDSMQTADTLKRVLARFNGFAHITEVMHGDIFVALLNFGVAQQLRRRCDYSVMLSPDVRSYVNVPTMTKLLEAVQNGARVAGVALAELERLTLRGRIANTFCVWHNLSLISAGGFHLAGAERLDQRAAHFVQGYDEITGEHKFYPRHGVEEIPTLVQMGRLFGRCIAAIHPISEGGEEMCYEVPDPAQFPEEHKKHTQKMATKKVRQDAHLAECGVAENFLDGCLIRK